MTKRPVGFMLILLSLVLMLIVSACGGIGGNVATPTPAPTRDPLGQFAPTPISPGRPQNPLQILYVPNNPTDVSDEELAAAVTTLENSLASSSGLAVQVVTLGSQGQAVDILCDYNDGARFAAAWLNGPSATIALARDCGEVVLKGTLGGVDGWAGQVIGDRNAGGLNAVQGRSFCRLGVDDFYSWILPTLAMQAQNLPPTGIEDVVDVPNINIQLSSVTDGVCYAMGTYAGILESELVERATDYTVMYESPKMPFSLFVVPPELLPADREALIQAYLTIGGWSGNDMSEAAEGEPTPAPETDESPTGITVDDLLAGRGVSDNASSEMSALITLNNIDGIAPASVDDLVGVQAFMDDTGLNLTGLER